MLHRKTRAVVSVLGIAIQVATVMILVGLVNGTVEGISARLASVGADVLFQPPDASFILGHSSAVMPVKYIEIMQRDVPEVVEATPVLNWMVGKIKDQARTVNLWGIDPPSFAVISGGFEILEGRNLEQPFDLLMDTVLANATGTKVGDPLPMMNRQFRVTGICRAGAGGRLYARIDDVQEAVGTPGKASFFLVKGRAAKEAEALATALQGRFKGYKITPVAQVSKAMEDNATGLKQFKQALTAMAVLVSFLVVLLAMYTTVIERTREIGILRAIGASQAKVVRLVVEESFWICIAGVAVGIVLAVLSRWMLPFVFPTLTITLSREWALIACSLGLMGGLIGSVYPALKAARLDPVQALNFE
jgi:putative ABC transport system permease protein